MADLGWAQENPDKRRRLAYMKARYMKPRTCRCGAIAFWLWDPTMHDMSKARAYCDAHLPTAARAALNRLQDNLFVVAPFFDEPEDDLVEDTTAWE